MILYAKKIIQEVDAIQQEHGIPTNPEYVNVLNKYVDQHSPSKISKVIISTHYFQ